MSRKDINKYNMNNIMNEKVYKSNVTAKSRMSVILKFFLIVFCILAVSAIAIVSVVTVHIFSDENRQLNLDLRSLKINLTSFIYVNDENGNPVEYQPVYAEENRVWVDYDQIPDAMRNAVVAIEDKRFYEHNGVDWLRTGGAITNFLQGKSSYGGSTITQQLIKNLTQKSDVSVTRKVTEIVTALMFETKYTKDEILETYLNVVSFGNNCNGVEAAALKYFDKHISECSVAECASIAGITQNPSRYDPLYNPDENKKRREVVLKEMYEQEYLTKAEYDQAMAESQNLTFANSDDNGEEEDLSQINDWYTEAMLDDIAKDLSVSMNVDQSTALYMVMHNGYKIYSAMDVNAQRNAEKIISSDESPMPSNQKIQVGYVMMGYDGRVLASVGQRGKKTANLLWDCATSAKRQPGSSFKPLGVYAPSVEYKLINYSSMIKDAPLTGIPGTTGSWPPNWYGYYKGAMTVQHAIEISSNAVAAQVLDMLTVEKSFEFVTENLGFTTLNKAEDSTYSALATGGGYNGVTVREMTAAYQTFGNGGVYNKPYTYFYVEDSTGKVILDNRNHESSQAMSSATATIMRRLLETVVTGSEGTGTAAKISGFTTFGKTGTTDYNENSWFLGGTPYAIAGIWTGYETPTQMSDSESACAIQIWKAIMTNYLDGKKTINFEDDSDVISASYCTDTGLLASDGCNSAVGYYAKGNVPSYCGSGPSSGNSSSEASSDTSSDVSSRNSSSSADSGDSYSSNSSKSTDSETQSSSQSSKAESSESPSSVSPTPSTPEESSSPESR